MEAQKKAKAYNDLKSLFERRQKALETVNAQLEGSLRDATDECESLHAQLTQAKLLLKKSLCTADARWKKGRRDAEPPCRVETCKGKHSGSE